MTIIPRNYQQKAIDKGIEALTNGENTVIQLPTGTGKSIVIAGIIQQLVMDYPDIRIMVVTHSKQLVEQNAAKLEAMCPAIPVGIKCAGLRRIDTEEQVIFASIASINKTWDLLGDRHIFIVDECHLISDKTSTMYQKVIANLRTRVKGMKVLGLSATPYRQKMGCITGNGVFDTICFDACSVEAFDWFVENEYMAPLIPKRTKHQIDMGEVKITAGDFNLKQLQENVDKYETTVTAVKEVIDAASDRMAWLVFTTGVDHAIHTAEIMASMGIDAGVVHSKQSNKVNDEIIDLFKAGEYRALVNFGVLTTGFDHPPIDCIVMLRHTISVSLWVQMLGRGTRPSPDTGKTDCLVMDFCGNTGRLGPINDPFIPKGRKRINANQEAPMKICPQCDAYNWSSARNCAYCDYEFPKHDKIQKEAGSDEVMITKKVIIETHDVNRVVYDVHVKNNIHSLKVSYYCESGLHVAEWICFDHVGYARIKAENWWKRRTAKEIPSNTKDAINQITDLKKPKQIRVAVGGKYPEIKSHIFMEREDG